MARRKSLPEAVRRAKLRPDNDGMWRCHWCRYEQPVHAYPCNPYDICDHGEHRTFELDHVVPVSRGGTNDPDNIVLACATCNRSRCNRSIEYLRARIEAR